MDQEDAHEIKPLAIELCVIDGCTGLENQFLSGMCSLCSNRLSCIERALADSVGSKRILLSSKET